MTSRKLLFTIKQIITVGIPLLAGNLSFYMLQVADTAMVGRLGTDALAAIAVASLVTGILSTFVWPVTVGTQSIASRRYGRQAVAPAEEKEKAAVLTGEVLESSLVAGLLAALLAIAASFAVPAVLRMLLPDKGVVIIAYQYISLYRWSLPFLGLAVACTGFLSAIQKTKPIMLSNILGNVINIGINYVLIFGKLGFPALGIRGAAIGTVISQAVCAFILFLPLLKRETRGLYKYFSFKGIKTEMLYSIFSSGFPVGVQNCIALFIFLVYQSLVGFLGTVYLAATHIVFSVFRINKTIVGGFARASSILVGNALGAEDRDGAARVFLGCQILAAGVGVLILLVILIFPEGIAGIFTKDPETALLGKQALLFFAVFFFIEVMGYSFEIIFTNNGWGSFVLLSEFSTNVIFILGCSFLAIKILNLGIYPAWAAFALYQVFHGLILFIGFLSKKWLKVQVEKRIGRR